MKHSKKQNKLSYPFNTPKKQETIRISLSTSALGDTIAWIPVIEQFRKKHKCKIIVKCEHIQLFKKSYPNINFENFTHGNDFEADYTLAYFFTKNGYDQTIHYKNPYQMPLQNVASDILGLEYKEIKPKVDILDRKPNILGKYVCIGTKATAQAKFWNNSRGWQEVVDFLRSIDYNVVCIDSHRGYGVPGSYNYAPKNIIDKTNGGLDLDDRIIDLKYADFFIGLGSGLSWLSWAVGTHTFMISGFSERWAEFQSNITRISQTNSDICSGCFNDVNSNWFNDMKTDFLWCPEHKDTDRQFECTKKISSEQVIGEIKKWLKLKNKL
jgi:autotransporter strand-loop-strand O-heptosyltransferase